MTEAGDAAYEALSPEDLYSLKGSSLASSAALDEVRKKDAPGVGEAANRPVSFNPLTFYVGRVARAFNPRSRPPDIRELTRYVNAEARTTDSLTGGLHWDYGAGLVRVNTPRSQGAVEFLSKVGRVELGDIAIECDNERASIIAISLDDRPLAMSTRILIQAVTEERPYGFRTDGDRIASVGGPPLGMKKIAARVWIRDRLGSGVRVTARDEDGYATDKPVVAERGSSEGTVEVILDPTSLYHVVQRQSTGADASRRYSTCGDRQNADLRQDSVGGLPQQAALPDHHLTAVAHQRLAGDGVRPIGAEEDHGVGHVVTLDLALQRGHVHVVRDDLFRLDAVLLRTGADVRGVPDL